MARDRMARIGLVGLMALVACAKGAPGGARDAGTHDTGTPLEHDAGNDGAPNLDQASTGSLDVGACAGLNGSDEHCRVRYARPSICTGTTPCAKMVLFFAGGEQDCDLESYDTILAAYVDAGFVATCIEIFETADGSGSVPYAEEAARVDTAAKAALADTNVGGTWSGSHLLWSGISHGATAPVTAMARSSLDDTWLANTTTGACFFDGIYDIAALDQKLGTSGLGGAQCLAPVSHARIVGRYYGGEIPFSHSCTNDKCACDPDHAPAMDTDTVTAVAASEFAVPHWKLIECGSALNPCTADIVPKEPIEALCGHLEADANHDCEFGALPDQSHLTCALRGLDECLDWFRTLVESSGG
ncbi:MAG: hypothetical protein R3A78_08625 [Polyangiales bacterium]